MPNGVAISGAVEGLVDRAVLQCLIEHVGAVPGPIYGGTGKAQLRRQIGGYNNAARFSPWVILVDLNREAECAPPLVGTWLPDVAPQMAFRVVVRTIEAWLLGDRQRLAAFLGVGVTRVPREPETLPDPKGAMVDLARQSRRRTIRDDMVPRPASGRVVGPAYTSRLVEFATDRRHGWRPAVAARSCDSLARCVRRMRRLMAPAQAGLR
jgi:hypothetical protein